MNDTTSSFFNQTGISAQLEVSVQAALATTIADTASAVASAAAAANSAAAAAGSANTAAATVSGAITAIDAAETTAVAAVATAQTNAVAAVLTQESQSTLDVNAAGAAQINVINTSANNAAASASAAAASASAASTSATTAVAAQTGAQAAEAAAQTAQSAAGSSATAAAASATAAGTSATSASTSATNAAASATAAASSAATVNLPALTAGTANTFLKVNSAGTAWASGLTKEDSSGNVAVSGNLTTSDGGVHGTAGFTGSPALTPAASSLSYFSLTPSVTSASVANAGFAGVTVTPTWTNCPATGNPLLYSYIASATVASGFTKAGTANYRGFSVFGATNTSGVALDNEIGPSVSAFSNGGNTTGTVNNYGTSIAAHTGAAAAGGTLNNYGDFLTVGTGSGAGITTNYGLYINGNGGSGGSGTTTNYALYSGSTAPSYLNGVLCMGLITSSTHMIDGRVDQNATTSITLRNLQVGTAAAAALVLNNNSTGASLGKVSTGFTSAGLNFADGTTLVDGGTGGLTLGTTTSTIVRFGTNNTFQAHLDTSGNFHTVGTFTGGGADTAEWRSVVPALYGQSLAGSLVGYDAAGNVTNIFANVVGRTLVGSTSPMFVGNDGWSTEANIVAAYNLTAPAGPPADPGAEPQPTTETVSTVDADGDTIQTVVTVQPTAEALAAYEAALATFNTYLAAQAAYQEAIAAATVTEGTKWTRVALCGLVPVTLSGITASDIGSYLVPAAAADGTITATAVPGANMTLPQYMASFGSIESIGADGRPLVNVKAC